MVAHTCQAEPAAETTTVAADSEATADAGLKVLSDSLLEQGQSETIGLYICIIFYFFGKLFFFGITFRSGKLPK